jgi:hypothetical protein
VSTLHYEALLEQVNGDDEESYLTTNELTALQFAGYCNVVTDYIRDRATKLTAYKEGIAEEDVHQYIFIFPEVDELVGEGGSTTNRGPEFPPPEIADAGPGCEEAEMEEVRR